MDESSENAARQTDGPADPTAQPPSAEPSNSLPASSGGAVDETLAAAAVDPTDVSANSADAPPPGPTRAQPAMQPDQDEPHLGWRRGDQLVFGTLLIASLVLMGIHWARMSGWGIRPVEIDRQAAQSFEYRLDVNKASWVELTQLEGVGDQLARKIVADREANGPFHAIEELRRVPGVGPKTLEKVCPWLEISGDAATVSRDGADAPRE
jgi:competence protein ComEA